MDEQVVFKRRRCPFAKRPGRGDNCGKVDQVALGTPFFVRSDSIVREIWGQSDVILFIFAGAAAEFALNKAVDWLYFTGRLPADPIGRLFSTVTYARTIVFAPLGRASKAIDAMRKIHMRVEHSRGAEIPDWAYRDVLFMLIHYSIAAFELLRRRLTQEEKEEVYDVFYRVGVRMGLKELPAHYTSWLAVRAAHLQTNLQRSRYTDDLFRQYRRQLGGFRYCILLGAQRLLVPDRVGQLLGFNGRSWLTPILPLYKFCRRLSLDRSLRRLLLPAQYKQEILGLDHQEYGY